MRPHLRLLAALFLVLVTCLAACPTRGSAAPRTRRTPRIVRLERPSAPDTATSSRRPPIPLVGVETSALRPLPVAMPHRFAVAVGGTPAAFCPSPTGVRAGYTLVQCIDRLPATADTPVFTGIGVEFPTGRSTRAYLQGGRVLLRNPVDVITATTGELWVTSAGVAVHF